MWIQVYGLPFVAMTEKMGQAIGTKLGRCLKVKTDEEGTGLGGCLAIRAEIDVRKKLMRRMKIEVEEDCVVFVDFKYERLPAICYCCGLLGHNELDCVMAIRKQKEGESKVSQYGKWLRAPLRQPRNRDYGGKGGSYGGNKQNEEAENKEEGRGGDNGGDQARRDGATEMEKGNSVIPMSSRDEREKLMVCLEPQNEPEGSDRQGEKTLTLPTIPLLGKDKEWMVIDEMAWQGQEGGGLDGLGIDKGQNNNTGHEEPKSPTKLLTYAEVGRTHELEENKWAEVGRSKKTGLIASTWQRKNREGENKSETSQEQKLPILGKRGERIEADEDKGEDYMRKRRKEQNSIPNITMAEAEIQPRQDQ